MRERAVQRAPTNNSKHFAMVLSFYALENPPTSFHPLPHILPAGQRATLRTRVRKTNTPTGAERTAAEEDDLHRFWTCPKLAESNNSAILDSAELVRRAVQQAPSYPVKWLRGLQPAEFTVGLVSEHPPIPIHRASGTFLLQNMQVKGKYLVGSDASGGPATRILGREESGGGSLSWTQTSNVLAL